MMTKNRRKQVERVVPGFNAYRVIQGVTLHINSSYDFLKYRGKNRSINVESYNKKAEYFRIQCERIEKQEDGNTLGILRRYLFHLTQYDPVAIDSPLKKVFIPPRELVTPHFEEAYSKYINRGYNRQESFKRELKAISEILTADNDKTPRKALFELFFEKNSRGAAKTLLTDIIMHGVLKLEYGFDTIVVLDRIGGISESILKDPYFEDSVHADLASRINKIAKLYDIDRRKYERWIIEFCEDTEKT